MNTSAASDFGTGGRNLLKAQHDTAQTNCHVSSVIYKIRDHGPAILDGEFYKDSSNAALPANSEVPAVTGTVTESVANTPAEPLNSNRGVIRVMLFSILLLTVALVSVGFYAYQQKMHVNDLQAELKIYDDLDNDSK
ncbi:MAG: hypothetical protein V4628_13615 [Pseudomonadota bacterium]